MYVLNVPDVILITDSQKQTLAFLFCDKQAVSNNSGYKKRMWTSNSKNFACQQHNIIAACKLQQVRTSKFKDIMSTSPPLTTPSACLSDLDSFHKGSIAFNRTSGSLSYMTSASTEEVKSQAYHCEHKYHE